ncbi:MAG TPA: PilT/PilU family type 4a pilus ATPase [Thermoanaerobaculia bacterium]|nr:PilT/PilU family type 4a pilus ATPase [Thermoanaerobaculia bacterium]
MLTRPKSSLSEENRALLDRIRHKQWKTPAERDDWLRRMSSVRGLAPEDAAFFLVDPDPALRTAGAAIVKAMPPEAGAEVLLTALASQPEPQRRKTFDAALQLLGGDLSPERAAAIAADPRAAVASAVLDWIREKQQPRFLSAIEPALSAASSAVRRRAMAAAEAIGTAQAAPLAVHAIADEDEEVRFRAASLLARHPSEQVFPALLKASSDTSARVQQAVAKAIEPIVAAGARAWQSRVMPLISDTNPRVRENAIGILRQQEPRAVVEAFIGSFKDVYGPPRDRAIQVFQELGGPFLSALADRADDPDQGAANLAASIAVMLRSPEVVPLCVRLLKQPDWWLRHRASEALATIKDDRGLEPLIEMLDDRESDLTAAAALGQWGTPKALPGLLAAYKKATMDLRLEILEAFSKIPDARVPALLQNISGVDPEPVVREKAVRLLRGLKGEGAEAAAEIATLFEPVDLAGLSEVTLSDLLRHARAIEASDLHLAVNAIPHVRVYGVMTPLPLAPLSEEAVEQMLHPVLSETQRAALAENRTLDFCYKAGPLGRFRTNIFYQRKGLDAVFRLIPADVPTLDDLGVPRSLWELAEYSQGLVLVTGPAGCGKTTTLAAFVDRINRTQNSHILTVEDPIEYVHRSRESLVNQREVGTHTESFAKALRQALREDPDVIMVGEMRDIETISLAITASETGHLVFGTLHTATAHGTIDRIIDAFPAGQQGQIRQMLSDSLRAVVSQHLVPRRDGRGRVAAFEILRNTPNVAGLIRDAKTFQISSAIQTGSGAGMQTMDAALLRLVQEGKADPRAAYDRALRKDPFEPFLEPEGPAA